MNLILLDNEETSICWSPNEPRAKHVREILRLGVGDNFIVGIKNGRMGRARILEDNTEGMRLEISLQWAPPAILPIHLLIGLPRPQVARRLLREMPSLGVERGTFFAAEKSEPAYRQSRLWSTGEWRKLLREGAELAFSTHIPTIQHADNLSQAVENLEACQIRIAFDLYETEGPFDRHSLNSDDNAILLAFGPEGGWTPRERQVLRGQDFRLLSLGARVMRVETAVIAATALASAHLGKIGKPLVT